MHSLKGKDIQWQDTLKCGVAVNDKIQMTISNVTTGCPLGRIFFQYGNCHRNEQQQTLLLNK